MKAKDYTVSKEVFDLKYNTLYNMLETSPMPSLEKLPDYYESADYISHTDGKRTFFEKVYQAVKRIALKQKVNLLAQYTAKGSLLDIGAGTGDFLVQAKATGWNTVGIEPNDKAKAIAQSKGISFAESLETLPNESFDAVTMWHVLEHVPDLDLQIRALKRLLKPNGVIIIAVPNFQSFDAQYYKQFWAAYDVPRHLWHFSKTAIAKLFGEKNIKLVRVKPMWFDSFYVSLLSEKYKTGKMNFVKGFFVGLVSNIAGIFKREFSSHIYILKNK